MLISTLTDTSKSEKIKKNGNHAISMPIPIPIPISNSRDDDLDLTEQYSLKSNIFDPSKMSPPDHWKVRLQQRIESHIDVLDVDNE